MHTEAWNWLAANIRPELERSNRVLDFGGYDVNGTPRLLFSPTTEYTALDARSGPQVDIVADATCWMPPVQYRSAFDVALCTEVFEHVEHWAGILYSMWVILKPAGACLVTCATHPRIPHSIVGVEPPPAGEWYRNVPLEELLAVMNFLFRNVRWATHPRGDIYMRGER